MKRKEIPLVRCFVQHTNANISTDEYSVVLKVLLEAYNILVKVAVIFQEQQFDLDRTLVFRLAISGCILTAGCEDQKTSRVAWQCWEIIMNGSCGKREFQPGGVRGEAGCHRKSIPHAPRERSEAL